MRKKGGIINAQPLPSLVGEGWGWGQYLSHRQDITDPTPAPPLDGRGVAAPSCATCPDFLKRTQLWYENNNSSRVLHGQSMR